MKCKKCNHEIKEGATFCAECGFPVDLEEPEEKLFCNQCGRRLQEGQKKCPYCSGKILEGTGLSQKNSEKMMIIGLEIGIVVTVGIIIALVYFNFFKREKTDNTTKVIVNGEVDSNNLDSYKQITEHHTQKIGDVVYSLKYDDETRNYTIYAERDGKKEEFIQNCKSAVVMTNGKYLYYATGSLVEVRNYPIYENRCIIQYTMESKISETLVCEKEEGMMYTPFACDGNYLYIGIATQYGNAYGAFYVLNLKDRTLTLGGNEAGDIQEVEGKLLVSATEFPHGGDLYFVNKDGTGYQSLTEEKVSEVEVKEGYIYFTEVRDMRFRKCRCNLDGTNKEILMDWES